MLTNVMTIRTNATVMPDATIRKDSTTVRVIMDIKATGSIALVGCHSFSAIMRRNCGIYF